MATTISSSATGSTNSNPVDIILFIDDQKKHVVNVASCGEKTAGMLINGVQGHPPVILWTSPQAEHFRKRLGEGTNAAAVFSIMKKRRFQLMYDPDAGINKQGIEYIKQWIKKTKADGFKKPAVLFDWDRTISVLEGLEFFRRTHFSDMEDILEQEAHIYGIKDNERSKFNLESLLEFFIGGAKRLAHIRKMFDFILKYNGILGILTNNTACKYPVYNDLVKQLFQSRPYQLICGMDFGFDKKKAINHLFKDLCNAVPISTYVPNIHTQTINNDISQYNQMNNNNNNNNSNTNSLALSNNSNTNSLALSNNSNSNSLSLSNNENENENKQNGSNFGEIWKNMLENSENQAGGKRKTKKYSNKLKRKHRKTRHH